MSIPQLLEYAEHSTRLDVVAITDHDDLTSSLEAREYAARANLRVQVVPGVEVTTREGHLLALFLEERPPALRPALETAEWAIKRGGLCIVPHPFTRWTHSIGLGVLTKLAREALIVGVEVLNASPAGRASQHRATRFAGEQELAHVGGSDAHMLGIVGLAHTRFRGRTPDDLKRALEERTCYADGRFAAAREVAAEALPQLARSMIHLPARRLKRAVFG